METKSVPIVYDGEGEEEEVMVFKAVKKPALSTLRLSSTGVAMVLKPPAVVPDQAVKIVENYVNPRQEHHVLEVIKEEQTLRDSLDCTFSAADNLADSLDGPILSRSAESLGQLKTHKDSLEDSLNGKGHASDPENFIEEEAPNESDDIERVIEKHDLFKFLETMKEKYESSPIDDAIGRHSRKQIVEDKAAAARGGSHEEKDQDLDQDDEEDASRDDGSEQSVDSVDAPPVFSMKDHRRLAASLNGGAISAELPAHPASLLSQPTQGKAGPAPPAPSPGVRDLLQACAAEKEKKENEEDSRLDLSVEPSSASLSIPEKARGLSQLEQAKKMYEKSISRNFPAAKQQWRQEETR